MSKVRFKTSIPLEADVSSAQLRDRLRQLLSIEGKDVVVDLATPEKLSFALTANDSYHGFKGTAVVSKGNDMSTVLQVRAKVAIREWFWPIFHLILTLIFLPYAIFGLWGIHKSQKKASATLRNTKLRLEDELPQWRP